MSGKLIFKGREYWRVRYRWNYKVSWENWIIGPVSDWVYSLNSCNESIVSRFKFEVISERWHLNFAQKCQTILCANQNAWIQRKIGSIFVLNLYIKTVCIPSLINWLTIIGPVNIYISCQRMLVLKNKISVVRNN